MLRITCKREDNVNNFKVNLAGSKSHVGPAWAGWFNPAEYLHPHGKGGQANGCIPVIKPHDTREALCLETRRISSESITSSPQHHIPLQSPLTRGTGGREQHLHQGDAGRRSLATAVSHRQSAKGTEKVKERALRLRTPHQASSLRGKKEGEAGRRTECGRRETVASSAAAGTDHTEQSPREAPAQPLGKPVCHQGIMFPTKPRRLSSSSSTGPVGGQRSSRHRDRDNNSDDFIYRVIKTHNVCKPQHLPRKNESPEDTGRRDWVRGWVG